MLGNRLREAVQSHTHKQRGRAREWLHNVDVDDFLDAMEVLNVSRATSDERLFSCPFPGHSSGDSRPSAYMNDGSKDQSKATVWKCHGCGRSGNAITFYAELENVSKIEATHYLKQQYAPNFRAPRGGSIAAEFEARLRERDQGADNHGLPSISLEVYEHQFAVDWQHAARMNGLPGCPPEIAYMFARGFTVDTLEAWSIGYDERSRRLTIPICDADGTIIGIKGRAWQDLHKLKYLILGDKDGEPIRYGWPHYEKSLTIFGLHMLAGPVETLVLVEGELDVIALWQIGIPAISTGSAHLSEVQARIVRQWCDELIVFYDSNKAGEQATFGWYDKDGEFHAGVIHALRPHIRVRVVPDHPDDASAMVQDNRIDELRELIASAQSVIKLMLD